MRKIVAEEIRSNPDTRKKEPDTLTRAEERALKEGIVKEYTGHYSSIGECCIILQYEESDGRPGYREVFNGCPTNMVALPEGLSFYITQEPMSRELLEEIVEEKFYDLFIE